MSILKTPKILLPKTAIDMSKWSVVACDQFTSEPEYWQELETLVSTSPSALRLIFPEVYLERTDKKERIAQINATMKSYLDDGIFDETESYVLVERTLASGARRTGLMIEVDLDEYEFCVGSKSLIRATEKTVVDRLPPRIEVRRNASLEIPHIMLLMDDGDKNILGKLYEKKDTFEKIYDIDLNLGGGHLRGYKVADPKAVTKQIMSIVSKDCVKEKYGEIAPILFAVGDGNHSLATAKECWKDIKKTLSKAEQKTHPARYSLCELVSVYDAGLVFEPIHRLILNADEHFIEFLQNMTGGDAETRLVYCGRESAIKVNRNSVSAIEDLQSAIDVYIANHPAVVIDYIHGDENLLEVAERSGGIALFMPKFAKSELFEHVARKGVLPRKAFSMGHAEEKRYYTEAKRIVKD